MTRKKIQRRKLFLFILAKQSKNVGEMDEKISSMDKENINKEESLSKKVKILKIKPNNHRLKMKKLVHLKKIVVENMYNRIN